MFNLLKYSDNYSKTSGILWQYCKGKAAVNNNGAVVDFTVANSIIGPFKIKGKITGKTGNDGIKNVEIMTQLKHLNNFCMENSLNAFN